MTWDRRLPEPGCANKANFRVSGLKMRVWLKNKANVAGFLTAVAVRNREIQGLFLTRSGIPSSKLVLSAVEWIREEVNG